MVCPRSTDGTVDSQEKFYGFGNVKKCTRNTKEIQQVLRNYQQVN